MWDLAAGTGMRQGELLALRWSDIDLDTGVVRVERSLTHIGGTRTYSTPKNHERREVALDGHLVTTLKTWRTKQVAERLALETRMEMARTWSSRGRTEDLSRRTT